MKSFPYKKRQIILYRGESSGHLFIVKSGVVRAYTTLDNGNEVIISLFGIGDYFPVSPNSDSLPTALFYYDMFTDGELEKVLIDDFLNDANIQQKQNNMADKRYVAALLHINALAQQSAFDKVVHSLRYLALRFGITLANGLYTRIGIKLTQQDMADLCNVSRETANIELNKLKVKSVIVEKNKYYSVDLRKINTILDDDLSNDLTLK